MPMVDIAGKEYEVDEEGYLVDLSQWNEDVAKYMAVEEKVDLTDSHWEVVNFLREYYAEYQIAPAVRVLVCGRSQTPSLDAVLELFTREQVLWRLRSL